jgi:hypothetical protein
VFAGYGLVQRFCGSPVTEELSPFCHGFVECSPDVGAGNALNCTSYMIAQGFVLPDTDAYV